MPSADLDALFAPRGIVLIGASASPDKLGYAMAQSLASYPGAVQMVNARPVPGMFASVADAVAAGSNIDLAVMCIPAAVTASAVRESADAGVRAALICAGGFAEAGGVGVDYAQALDEVVADTGVRVLGPNTSGFFVPGASLFASFVPGVRTFDTGSVAVVAASGGINHVLSFALQEEGAGVSLGVGLGAGRSIAAPDVLRYLIGHEQTKCVILHVETIPDGQELVEAVTALSAVKPVIALVVGRSDVSEFARSHTGALTTSWRTATALLRQAGAVIVDDEAHAVAAAIGLSKRRARPNRSAGIGLITGQAGPGLVIADGLLERGWDLPGLADPTRERLAELLPPLTFQGNPVDTGRPGESFSDVISAVGQDESIDILGLYAITEPVLDLPAALAASSVRMPAVIAIDGASADVASARQSAREADVPIVRGPTPLARALAALAEDARLRALTGEGDPAEDAAAAVPAGLRGGEWDEVRAKDLLGTLAIATPMRRRCTNRSSAHDALAQLGGPVVVKILDSAVIHKSDIGGVILNVDTSEGMDAALDSLTAAGASEFLVEQMVGAGLELVVGARRDESFGPVVMLGLGGVAAEVIADVAIRSAPLNPRAAADMIDDLAGAELLGGHRGAPPVDRDDLARIIVAVGAAVATGAIAELEINPLRATARGLIALDAVVLPVGDKQNGVEDD